MHTSWQQLGLEPTSCSWFDPGLPGRTEKDTKDIKRLRNKGPGNLSKSSVFFGGVR